MRTWMALVVLIAHMANFSAAQEVEPHETWSKIAPAEDNAVFEQILEYRKKGDFASAAAVALKPVHGREPDDFLLQTTATTYFLRAQNDQANKTKWVNLAVEYSERALQANPRDLVNLFNVGDSYMAAGMNLGRPQGCEYYRKSIRTFERLQVNPGMQGEWGVIEGERVQLAPYRQKLQEHMSNLLMLASKCPGVEGE